ncbi:MAG TPA: metal-dependent hydrolase [Kamptonema sp.]|nr:metal-dependent hydrolase [Kamptonema sp.]
MMAITHAVASVAIGSLALQTADTTAIALLIAGSQLPDIDNTQSTVGRMVWPLARFIEERWPHRSITHSLWSTVAIATVSFFISQKLPINWVTLPLGHFIAICTDTLTPEGVQLFWPSPVWAVCGSNPNARIRTGSKGEIMLLAFFAAILALSIWTIDSGGVKLWVNQLLGVRDGVMQTISQSGASKHIYVDIVGTWTSDRKPVNQRFWVIEQEGNEFVIADRNGIYKTGLLGQIAATRLVPQPGEAAQTQVLGVDFSEEEIAPKLEAIAAASPQSLIFLSGTVTIDGAEEIQISVNPKQLQVLKIVGNQAQLDSCPISLAIAKLNLQFGSGSLKAKVVYPPPKL